MNKFWILRKVSPAPIVLNSGFGSQTTVLNFGFGSRTTALDFRLGSLTTVLNFRFDSRTTVLNFQLGSRTAEFNSGFGSQTTVLKSKYSMSIYKFCHMEYSKVMLKHAVRSSSSSLKGRYFKGSMPFSKYCVMEFFKDFTYRTMNKINWQYSTAFIKYCPME